MVALSNLGDDVVQTGMLESEGRVPVNNYSGHWFKGACSWQITCVVVLSGILLSEPQCLKARVWGGGAVKNSGCWVSPTQAEEEGGI